MAQNKSERTVALVSPNKNAYSETFIRSQKELLPFNILYYYGGTIPRRLEKNGNNFNLTNHPSVVRTLFCLRNKLTGKKHEWDEYSFAKSLEKERPGAVIAHYGRTAHAVLPVCRKLGLPLITNFHGYDVSKRDILTKYNNYDSLFKKADIVIAVSRKMQGDLEKMGCPKEKLRWNPSGARDSFQKVEPDFKTSHFFAVGRFTDKKAPYYTILAFADVVKKHPQARLTMGGEGVLLNSCRNLAGYLGLEKTISFPGILTHEDVSRFMKNSIAFVQHSIQAIDGDSEGTPTAIIEASAASLPVISTKHAGIPEVVIDGETGLLVEEHDVAGMAEAMSTLLENKTLARKMGAAGKTRVKKYYSMGKHIERLTKIIEEVIQ